MWFNLNNRVVADDLIRCPPNALLCSEKVAEHHCENHFILTQVQHVQHVKTFAELHSKIPSCVFWNNPHRPETISWPRIIFNFELSDEARMTLLSMRKM